MIKLSLLRICASLPILLLLSSCGSTPRAPVDSRTKTPTPEAATYTQAPAAPSARTQARDFHIVEKGDTLYSIAWRYGYDYKDVAKWNDISEKYVIYPGQFIRLKPVVKTAGALKPGPIVSNRSNKPVTPKPVPRSSPAPKPAKALNSTTSQKSISWRWPTKGKLIKLNTPSAKKGVDITGRAGQQVNAAAKGEVVYSGSGLLGYGKLIIIKHNDTYLSAYAHNENLYAKEGDIVESGQKIATMGLGHKGRALLHFEIRKNGSPVDPLRHLPRQKS